MPTLRQIIDGKVPGIEAASPAATAVSKTLTDPVEDTKEGFTDLTNKRLQYDVAKESMKRKLLPAKAIMDHVSQLHELDDDGTHPQDQDMNNDPAQGYQEEKQGVPPNMTQRPGMMQQSAPNKNTSYPGAGPKIGTPPMGVGKAAQQQKPTAPKPKGAGSMPKKPGTPGAGKDGRAIKVNVTAKAQVHQVGNAYQIRNNARTLDRIMGAEQLRQAPPKKK